MDHLLINTVGYAGSVLLILAFLLNCMKKLDSASPAYQLMNLTGATLTLFNAWFFGAMPSATISVFWMVVSVVFLVRGARNKVAE